MEFFRIRRDIPFMRHALVFNVISLVTFLLAVFFLATRGLHLSVEFTGGTLMEVAYSGKPMQIAFNPEFLMAPLRNLESDTIYLDLIDEMSPGVVRIDGSFLYVIMPMRVTG